MKPLTTPVTSPQFNGMAEAFVRTIKRDYARVNPLPDARTAIESRRSGSTTTTPFIRAAPCAIVRRPRIHRRTIKPGPRLNQNL